MLYSRRELGKLALIGLPVGSLLARDSRLVAAVQAKPNSKFAGVQIGWNITGDYKTVIEQCLATGISGIETRSSTVESFLGIPAEYAATRGGGGGRGRGAAAEGAAAESGRGAQAGRGQGRQGTGEPAVATPGQGRGGGRAAAVPLTPEQEAERARIAAEGLKWRMAVPASRMREAGKFFADAGVVIEILKFDGMYTMSDDMLDYAFTLAKNVGARALSTEIDVEGTRRVGQFADKHQMKIGYHNHASITTADFDRTLSYAKYNAINLDLGHFVAGNSMSPVPFIKANAPRITHFHVKDRKFGTNGGANLPFGEGETPLVEVLRLVRDNKWNIQMTLELEYPTPAGSDRLTEVRKCVEWCRKALVA